jgi:hypothetical protein
VKPLLAALVVTVALLVSGCGSGGTTIYTKQATEACLTKAGLQPKPVSETADFVANSATGGAFVVQLVDNRVTVSFGETEADADNIDQAYRRFKATNVGINDVLRRQGNALMLWHVHPLDNDLAAITGCLKK